MALQGFGDPRGGRRGVSNTRKLFFSSLARSCPLSISDRRHDYAVSSRCAAAISDLAACESIPSEFPLSPGRIGRIALSAIPQAMTGRSLCSATSLRELMDMPSRAVLLAEAVADRRCCQQREPGLPPAYSCRFFCHRAALGNLVYPYGRREPISLQSFHLLVREISIERANRATAYGHSDGGCRRL